MQAICTVRMHVYKANSGLAHDTFMRAMQLLIDLKAAL